MAEVSFSVQAGEMLETIVAQLEAEAACDDLDMDIIDGVLNIGFEDGGQIIVNRQEPVRQLWVASPLGPAHFSFDAGRGVWIDDKTGATLMDTLGRALTQKLGVAVTLQD